MHDCTGLEYLQSCRLELSPQLSRRVRPAHEERYEAGPADKTKQRIENVLPVVESDDQPAIRSQNAPELAQAGTEIGALMEMIERGR